MNAQENLIDQLEGVLAGNDLSRCAEVLRCVTDLFIHGSGKFSDDQIDLFDDVMSKLVLDRSNLPPVGSREPARHGFRRASQGDPHAGVRRIDRSGLAGSGAFRAAR